MSEPTKCAECGKALKSLVVTNADGSRRHPDCYETWKQKTVAAMSEKGIRVWGGKASA